jgi:hypothetical protein
MPSVIISFLIFLITHEWRPKGGKITEGGEKSILPFLLISSAKMVGGGLSGCSGKEVLPGEYHGVGLQLPWFPFSRRSLSYTLSFPVETGGFWDDCSFCAARFRKTLFIEET